MKTGEKLDFQLGVRRVTVLWQWNNAPGWRYCWCLCNLVSTEEEAQNQQRSIDKLPKHCPLQAQLWVMVHRSLLSLVLQKQMYLAESDASFASIELHQKPSACKAVAQRGTKGAKGAKIYPVPSYLLTVQCNLITGGLKCLYEVALWEEDITV